MRWKSHVLMLALVLGCLVLGAEHDVDSDGGSDDVNDDTETSNSDDTDDEELQYESPVIESGFYFAEHFDDKEDFGKRWVKSEAKKDDIAEEVAKYDGVWENELPQRVIFKNDYGLVLKSKAKHAAISSRLLKSFDFTDKSLVVQYEVNMQEGQECGGAYLKLLTKGKETERGELTKFNDKTPYTIMFGPDKCGNDVKLHFIFRHLNPLNKSITEHHCRKPKERVEEPFKDKEPHLYQLVVNPDNTFKVKVDHRVINEGSLLTDFEPPVNPPREIDDPDDKKPENWDEREKIPDPNAKKPDDWDEDAPPQIPDPNAVKPEGWLDDEDEMIPDPGAIKPDDWDTEMDGEWEAPLIENPVCEKAVGCGLWKAPLITNTQFKGKWRAPLIENPNYQGKWVPRKIPNPDFFEDLSPFKSMKPFNAIGFELWSMSSNILFDNILITDREDLADEWAAKTYDIKRKHIEKRSKTFWERALRHMGYKPGWWALYFIYVSIPVSLYIRYLVKRYKEESFFSKVFKMTSDNPWLLSVYAIVVLVPVAFIIYTLCFSKDKKAANERAQAKKTDEPTPEDIEEVKEPAPEAAESVEKDAAKEKPSQKSKKSDLDVDKIENVGNNEEEVEEEVDEEVISDENENEDEKEVVEENNVVEDEATNVKPSAETVIPDGTRKRQKPRRE